MLPPMSELSEIFDVEVRPPLYLRGQGQFPDQFGSRKLTLGGDGGNVDKFWHRGAARRFIRSKFNLFRSAVRSRFRSRKTPV